MCKSVWTYFFQQIPRSEINESYDYLNGLPWWLRQSRICLPMQVTQVRSLGWEDSLEKGMATHSSILAWGIPPTEEPGRLQSKGHRESDMTKAN